MKTIHKYPIELQEITTLQIPADAEVLTVQTQHYRPTLWALVDTDKPKVERIFELFTTGHEIKEGVFNRKYIGTFQAAGGGFVGHLFERLNP